MIEQKPFAIRLYILRSTAPSTPLLRTRRLKGDVPPQGVFVTLTLPLFGDLGFVV